MQSTVGFQQFLRGHLVGIEQPIGGLGLLPTAAGGGDGLVGPLPEGLDQGAGAPVQARIPQIQVGQFIAEANEAGGAHAAAPRRCTGGGASPDATDTARWT